MGAFALQNPGTYAVNNTTFGAFAGQTTTYGDNTMIGSYAGYTTSTVQNSTYIGARSSGYQYNAIIGANSSLGLYSV